MKLLIYAIVKIEILHYIFLKKLFYYGWMVELSRPDSKVEHVATAAFLLVDLSFSEHLPRTYKAYRYQNPFEKRIPNDLYENMIFKIN